MPTQAAANRSNHQKPAITQHHLSFRAEQGDDFLRVRSRERVGLRSRGISPLCSAVVLLAVAFFLSVTDIEAQTRNRPAITGIGSVKIALSDPGSAVGFYIKDLGFGGGMTVCNGAGRLCLGVDGEQRIDLVVGALPKNGNNLIEVLFSSPDVEQMRNYLKAQGIQTSDISEVAHSNRSFQCVDPDGHGIGFIQYLAKDSYSHPENQASHYLIHAGFIVRDQAAMDHFYKEILGFRPYWHGGMKDDETSWISLQVPDGTDWVEFMVNLPPNPDQHLRGVMNHIALGVVDIHATREQLVKNGVHLTEEPKLGRDGKWQLNLYDPDQTRIEFMEFTPKEKPCCSEFTGPHPKP